MSFKSLKSARFLARHIGSAALAAAICVAAVSVWAAGPLSSIDDVRVGPLLTTHWGQSDASGQYCYNYYTPLHRVCGCTATALGQVMYYHRYPTERILPGEYLYDTIDDYGRWWVFQDGTGGMTNTTSGAYTEFDPPYGGPYEWNKMVDSPTGSTPADSRAAIGRLTRDAGLAVFSHYFTGETSGFTDAVASSVILNLHYADAVKTGFNAGKLIANLDAGLPVLLNLTGHAVVADGYGYHDDKLYIHINYGYSGSSDGWYDTTTDINGKSLESFVANIFPPTLGTRHSSVISGRVLDTSGNPVAGATVTATGATNVTTTSSANGIYAFILPAGNYTFAASKSGAAGSSAYTVAASEQKTRAEGDGWGSGVNNSASGIDVTVYTESDFAKSWSNNANDGRFDNPQNWTGGTLPASGDDVAVFASGDTVISSETAMTVGTVSVPSGTVMFSGSGAVITLGGLNLLSAGSTVEITGREGLSNGSIKGVGTLVVNPGADNTYTMPQNNGGNAVPFDAAYFWGETVIKSGTVKFGNIWSFGSRHDSNDNRQIPTVRVKGGATLDENALSTTDYSGETLRVILEEGATLKSTGNSSSGLTSIFLEGNATVDTSSGKVVACYGYDSYASSPVWVSLGTNTLTKVGSGQFYLSGCYCIGTGTLDVQQGEVRVKTDSWNYFPTSTLEDGTLRIRSGATFTLEKRGDNPTHFTVKDLVLDGTLARTAADCVFTVTGTVTGSGTAAALALAQGAVFKPSGAGYLTITDSLSGVFELDMSGVDLSSTNEVPLVSVPSALADGVSFAPATIPEGWSVLQVPENGNVRYLLIEGEAVEMPTSPTPTAFSVGQQTVVTLTCATEGATIYYTTDGSDPTTSSTAYSAPFAVTDGTTVKARAYKTGWRDSLIYIATFTYVPPATLTHRWSFNGTSDAECLADSIGGVNATKGGESVVLDGSKAVVASNGSGNNKGYLEIGGGVLGSGDATLEIWYEKLENPGAWSSAFAYGRDGDNRFQINTAYGYNQEYGRTTGSSRAPVTARIGGTERISSTDWNTGCLASLVPNLPQHISITFKRNSDGSTMVRWMSRDSVTGFLMKECSGTIPSWTLADAPDFIITLGRDIGSLYDLKGQFHEVRTWNGVLSDEQLSVNAFAGPDAPVGGRESAFSTGFDIAAGSTFTIGKEGMFRTDGSVGVGTGASIVFDTANFSGTEMKFVTGGFSLPAGASSVLDFVTLTDSDNYVASVDGGTITVVSAQPAYAKWIGASAPASMNDLTNAVNWTCYRQDGTTVMSGAVPGYHTTLLIDGTTSFTLPTGLLPTWGSVLVGGHAAPHYGRIASTGGDNNWITFRERPNTDYTPCGEKAVSYLDRTSGNSPSDLGGSQLRFDGWIYASAEQAGRWNIRAKMDDMITFAIDGEWQFYLNTYQYAITAGSYVSEGWHRFTLIVRDTGGGYGANMTLNGKNYPFVVSINGGAEVGFSQLTFGAGPSTVTLAADCDWSALGEVNFANGVILDLNGHNLKLNDFTTDSFGSMVTNSAAKKAIMYFTKETSESRAVASGMIKEVDVKIILAKDGDQIATWTGAANDGDPENPNNWENLAGEPVLPTADYTVKISGNNVNLQSAYGIDCKAFEIGTCTFTADCDWRGLDHVPSILGEVNLNGHNLYLAGLNAVGGSFVNNAADTTSRVLFDVAENGSYSEFSEQLFIGNISSLSTGENVFLSLLKPDDESDTTTATLMLLGKSANVTAEFVQTNGTVNLGDSVNKFGDGSGHRGVYAMYGGTLTTGGGSEFVIGANGNGTFNLSGGNVTIGNWISVGRFSGGNGTFNMTGGSLTVSRTNRPMWLGGDNGTGVFNFGGTATATFKGIDIGRMNNGRGTLNMNGGTLTVSNGDGFNVGRDAVGIVEQNDGTLNVNTIFRLAWGSGGSVSGTYTLNGGTVNVNADTYWGDGRSGTFVQNGGTMNANNGVNLAVGGSSSANLTLAGGVFNTKFFNKGSGTANITFNGGTVAALENTSTFFRGIPSVNVGAGGMTFDTAGRTVEISDLGMNASAGSSFTKAGAGTLTMDTLPPTESVVVSNGTFALKSAPADSSHPALTHRWSFTGGSLADTVGGSTATTVGSALTFADNAVTMSGNGSGTGSLRLGNGLVSGDNVTFEFWARHDATKSWSPVFEYGIDNNNEIALTWEWKKNDFSWPTMFFYTNGNGNYTECWWSSQWLFEDHKKLHIVVRIETGEDGKAVVTTIVRNAENPSAEAKVWTQPAPDGWTLARLANSGVFCLGGSLCGDPDANATYDEVRIWNGALSNGEIADSFAKGPDATDADIEAIFASDAGAPSAAGAVAVALGGTLDLGGNEIEREYVSGGGTVINGTLTASKKLRAKLGDCLTISSGATFNIDGAKVAFSAEDIASLRTKPRTYMLVKTANGGTIGGNLLQPATDAQLPTGWHVIQTPGSVTLRKNGVTIHIR